MAALQWQPSNPFQRFSFSQRVPRRRIADEVPRCYALRMGLRGHVCGGRWGQSCGANGRLVMRLRLRLRLRMGTNHRRGLSVPLLHHSKPMRRLLPHRLPISLNSMTHSSRQRLGSGHCFRISGHHYFSLVADAMSSVSCRAGRCCRERRGG